MKRILIVFLLPLATGAFAAAQLYRWVDDKGRPHYGEKPPEGVKAVVNRLAVGNGPIPGTQPAPAASPAR